VSERLDLDDYLPYLLNRVGFALVERFTAQALKSHALSIEMWRVLAALSHNGAQRQIDLVGMTSIDASTMSRLVTRLVTAGLATRSRSVKSSREVVVALSPKGRALLTRLIPIARDMEQTAATGISGKDMAVLKRALHQMYRNMAGSRTGGRPRMKRNHAARSDGVKEQRPA
jgi:MarR family transcriptional regulator, organic hydroperoxide resistance regulator